MSTQLRSEALGDLIRGYPYEKKWAKLSISERAETLNFCMIHEHLGHLEFEHAVNRWKLDQTKTRFHTIMMELACSANSRALGRAR